MVCSLQLLSMTAWNGKSEKGGGISQTQYCFGDACFTYAESYLTNSDSRVGKRMSWWIKIIDEMENADVSEYRKLYDSEVKKNLRRKVRQNQRNLLQKPIYLWNYSSIPIEDQLKLWDICVFNYLIGNTDNHIKNLSLLYGEDLKTIRLAPAYDIVSTMIYESSTENMALSIDGKYNIYDIKRKIEIEETMLRNIAILFQEYSSYKGLSEQKNRFLDYLILQGKVMFFQID